MEQGYGRTVRVGLRTRVGPGSRVRVTYRVAGERGHHHSAPRAEVITQSGEYRRGAPVDATESGPCPRRASTALR